MKIKRKRKQQIPPPTARRSAVETVYRCGQCIYETFWKHDLKSHMNLHTGEKMFKCDKCPYTTIWGNSFKRHVRTHTGEKPFKCHVPGCDSAFIRSEHLKKHLARDHTRVMRNAAGVLVANVRNAQQQSVNVSSCAGERRGVISNSIHVICQMSLLTSPILTLQDGQECQILQYLVDFKTIQVSNFCLFGYLSVSFRLFHLFLILLTEPAVYFFKKAFFYS